MTEKLLDVAWFICSVALVYSVLKLFVEAGRRAWVPRAVEWCKDAVMWVVTLRLVSMFARAVKYGLVKPLRKGGQDDKAV